MEIYLQNRVDRMQEIEPEEIAKKFMASGYYQNWKDGGRPMATYIGLFISSDNGLDASFSYQDEGTSKDMDEVVAVVLRDMAT